VKKNKPEKSLSMLVKELDTVFSLFIRLRDADHQGTVKCFVTGEKVWWKDAQAAHWIPRANMIMRWAEDNVHACTKESNQYDPNHIHEYDKKMASTYSIYRIQVMRQTSKSLAKWTRPELEDLIDLYTDKVKELKKLKGL